jgi:hypothetical protein
MFFKKDRFYVSLEGYDELKPPDCVVERAKAKPGVTFFWTDSRGVTIELTAAVGDTNFVQSYGWRVIDHPSNMTSHRASMWKCVQMGRSKTLRKALEKALSAPKREIDDA